MEKMGYFEVPSKLPYQLLRQITNDFSREMILGSGATGTVYKGVFENGEEVAVKVLHNILELDDKEFQREFNNLMVLKHPNILELVGFCKEWEEELALFEGKQVIAERWRMALCFEFAMNGSLYNLISDEKTGLTWHTRYRIIKGICEGLKYLREGLEYPIMHFNLTPHNILLDENLVPKIADFGLSKLFGEENTRKTMSYAGTSGYWPPEYIKHQIISREFDIFSLGVIIVKIMTGHEGYNSTIEMTTQKAVWLVHESWKKKLRETLNPTLLEVYCNQVKVCIKMALDCLKSNRFERPTIQDIISVLYETETMIHGRGMQNEQFYQDDGESTHPSGITKITIDSRPLSGPPVFQDSSICTPRPADHSTFSRTSSTENKARQEPNKLPYHLIKEITNNFGKDRILGKGGFGTVYKGVLENKEEIAVKVLDKMITDINDKEFCKEFDNLKRLQHQNVVGLVGYCSEEEEDTVHSQGKQVTAVRIRLALCFEFVHNGSLEKNISDEHTGFDWPTRYKIINGICEGLKYLHEKQIVHCDLKPGNILLDKNEIPKIADFGLSKLFGEENTIMTMSSIGTCGYQPREFLERQIVSREFDIYSLGVIIVKIITGHEGYKSGIGTGTPNSVNLVHESWMKRLRKTRNHNLYGCQVKRCIGIAIDCLKTNRRERPTIGEIVSRLNKQYYQDYGASTQPSRIARITIESEPSSEGRSEVIMSTDTENLWDVAPQRGQYLDRYISDIGSGFDWQTRYSIIKSICKDLEYFHDGLKSSIIHKNLKTSNILLDENMIPGLRDFCIPRLTGDENDTKTTSMMGTIEHMPPEFIEKQVISKEFDIYSFGVIFIKVMTGDILHSELPDMSSMDFIELVHGKWRERLQETVHFMSVEGYCQQAKKCLEIALKCVEADRRKRPTIGEIICTLSETETMTPGEQIDLESKDQLPTEARPLELLIDVHPLELCFQFMSSLELPIKKDVSCLLHLNNRGNDRVAFMLVAKNPKMYLTRKPLCGVVPPRSTYSLTLIMPKLPLSSDKGDFFTLHNVAVEEYDLLDVDRGSSVTNEYDKFFKTAKEVQQVMLKVLCCQEADDQGTSSCEGLDDLWQPTPPTVEIITTPDAKKVSSMEVHPEEPWIMTTNHVGGLRVWDYHTMLQTPLNSSQFATYEPVHAAKFIARVKWLVAGDWSGGIHVYSYDKNQHVKSFDAHDGCITTLAVHPTHPYILSSSSEDENHVIKLWDWGNSWKCTRPFLGHTKRVTQVVFNPENEDSFASASWDGTVKIWSICSDDPKKVITLVLDTSAKESLLCVDYFTRCNQQHLIVGCKNKTAQIWRLGMNGCVDVLQGHGDRITCVNLHPKLPILTTGSLDGTVCIWDSTTYKLENTIAFNLGAVYAFGCIKGSTRIMVACDQGIATMELSSP